MPKALFYYVTLVLIFFSQFSFGNEEAFRLFNENFNNPKIYEEGNCPTNIWRFLKLLDQQGISVNDEFKVLYVYRFNIDHKLTLTNPRNESEWDYHVVLAIGNQVLDFDFDQTPLANTAHHFFIEQFGESELYGDFMVKPIPAQEYKDEYNPSQSSDRNFYYYLLPENDAYTELSLDEFLEQSH